MSDDEVPDVPPPIDPPPLTLRQRKNAYEAKRQRKKKAERDANRSVVMESGLTREEEEKQNAQLANLAKRTAGQPTDADADIDFAYRHMSLPSVRPVMAPSVSAWSWYLYSRDEPKKFLEICAKREDAKAKMAGTITNQRMEDDRRNQFAVIDRIEKQLTMDVEAIVSELMEKFPLNVLRTCRKFDAVWKEFLATES